MSIKRFTGLGGDSDHPFSVGGQVSTATIRGSDSGLGSDISIVVDPANGFGLADPFRIDQNRPKFDPPPVVPAATITTPTQLPGTLTAAGMIGSIPNQGPTMFFPTVQPRVLSQDSAPVPYETIFHDFGLRVMPVYNFWTQDETTNDRDELGDRNLDDVPRYIKVSWDPAPDLSPPINGGFDRYRPTVAVLLGLEIQRPTSISVNGVQFLPDHMQAQNFSLIMNSLANGHVSPGVVSSVIEMPLHTSGLDTYRSLSELDPIHRLDEAAFLRDPGMRGVSLSELVSNIHQMTNGVLGAAAVSDSHVPPQIVDLRSEIFDDGFSVHKSPFPGGELQVHAAGSTATSLSLVVRSAFSQETVEPPVLTLAKNLVQSDSIGNVQRFSQVKATFVDLSLGGAILPERIATMSQPQHVEAMTSLASMLPNLEMLNGSALGESPRKISLPSFPTPAGFGGLSYIGYILEKYAKSDAGNFELVETIGLANRELTEYFDTKVKYGGIYRYRIRSVVRWTRPSNVGIDGPEPLTIRSNGSQTQALAPNQSSYFCSEWGLNWEYGQLIDIMPPPPPDEFTVRPDSVRKQVIITFKIPSNPQRDIYIMRIVRKIQDSFGRDITSWFPIVRDFGAQNVVHIDPHVQFFEDSGYRFVYSAYCISRHGEFSTLCEQLSVRLNKNRKVYGEYPVEFLSCKGVTLDSFGSFSVYPFRKNLTETVLVPAIGQNRVFQSAVEGLLIGREGMGNSAINSAHHIVRIQSLDTGETGDIRLDVDYEDQPASPNILDLAVHVPDHGFGQDFTMFDKAGRARPLLGV